MSKKKKPGALPRKRLDDSVELPPEEDDALAPPKRGPGRPSTYLPQNAKIAEELCKLGATDSILADTFGISTVQVQKWQTMHPEFGAAVLKGKSDFFDPLIERSLAQRALGYAVDTEEVKVMRDGGIIRYPLRKHYPPDVTAMIFWLKNRQPARWRDVWKIDHSGKVDTSNMTSEQVLSEIKGEMEKLGLLPQQVVKALGVAPFPKDRDTKH